MKPTSSFNERLEEIKNRLDWDENAEDNLMDLHIEILDKIRYLNSLPVPDFEPEERKNLNDLLSEIEYIKIENDIDYEVNEDEYFEDERIDFDDYEDFSFDENDDDFEDNDDDFEDNDENEIDPFETVIWDYITNSAKRKFDYQSYLADFPKEIGKNIPDNILWKIIMLSSSGYDEIHISSLIMSDLIMLGFMFPKDKLIPFVIDRKKDFGLEILATQIATDALNMGSAPEAVLGQVNQLLR